MRWTSQSASSDPVEDIMIRFNQLAPSTSENNRSYQTPSPGKFPRRRHTNTSLSRRSDQDSSSEELPELRSSSEDDDKAQKQATLSVGQLEPAWVAGGCRARIK